MKVKVGGIGYTVRVVGDKEMDKEAEVTAWGACDFLKQEILIRGGMGADRSREVLWHEIIHAISIMGRLGLRESQIDLLGGMIQTVLKDNAFLRK